MATKTKEQKQAEFDKLIEKHHEIMYDLAKDLKMLGEYEYRVTELRRRLYRNAVSLGSIR